MTIRKRLAISNILMILVPVCITMVIAVGSLALTWYAAIHGMGLGFQDSEDFFHASKEIAEMVADTLSEDPEGRIERLDDLGSILNESAVSLTILKNSTGFYSYGESLEKGDTMLLAVSAMGGEGAVSNGDRSLYAQQTTIDGDSYQIYLSCIQQEASYRSLKVLTAFVGVVLLFTIFLAVLLTNRFLIRFVFRKIEEPLDTLSSGVHELRDGNLDYRITYDREDEFLPVCNDFNEMAVQLKQSVTALQQQEQSRKELIAGISHDIRSPLTSIQAYVEGLLDGVARTPEAQQRYLHTIKAKAEDLEHMVSQLFLFSKMELGDYPENPCVLRLDEKVSETVSSLREEYAGKGLMIETTLVPAVVQADPLQLERVITNIMGNSLKYKDKDEGHIRISLERNGDNCTLTFADDGPGVPEESLPKLFEVFYRSDPARQHPNKGSGLGLAIVASAVQRMGGTVLARNGTDRGLEIAITLPIYEEGNHAEHIDR